MCNGSKSKVSGEIHEKESYNPNNYSSSPLLEFSASDDLKSFTHLVEEEGNDVDELSLWYGRKFGSKKMGFEERTPLMIASMFGSMNVLNYILGKGSVDINRISGSDGSTALGCAAAGGSHRAHEVIELLTGSCTNSDVNRPLDVISPCFSPSLKSKTKEYPIDPSLPDIKNGVYVTDEFRMYTFKIKPCSRTYSHDWTECPFVHPGENARRRDPRKYPYSCVPCPEFRKGGSCPKADSCEYAHGIFESWLHPAQYRTRLCKDEIGCTRRVCFFAHKHEELRPLYASTGSGVPSPRSFEAGPMSPSFLGLGSPSKLMSPTVNGCSSPIAGAFGWASHLNLNHPPTLQLPPSRLNHQQLRPSYSSGTPSSPITTIRGPPFFGVDQCGSPVSNRGVPAFGNRTHNSFFIDSVSPPAVSNAMTVVPLHLSDWCSSPDGKVDWGPNQWDPRRFEPKLDEKFSNCEISRARA